MADQTASEDSPHVGSKRLASSGGTGAGSPHKSLRPASSSQQDANAHRSLPLVAMELLFSFAMVDLSVQIESIPMQHQRAVTRRETDAFSLRRWSTVCHDWRDAIEEVITQSRAGTVQLQFQLKQSEDLKDKIASSMQQPQRIQDLRVGIYRHIDTIKSPTLPTIDWQQVLSKCTNLLRLDLSDMNCLTIAEIGELLDAVSRCCPKLRGLVIPKPYGWRRNTCTLRDGQAPPTDTAPIMAALGPALQRWHEHGSPLQQLTLPLDAEDGEDFVALVAKYAPRMQLLDAWKMSYFSDGWGDAVCDEHWHVLPSTWEALCQSCVELREFNFGLLPFCDTYLLPFAAKTKWKLTQLALVFARCNTMAFLGVNEIEAFVNRRLRVPMTARHMDTSSVTLRRVVRAVPRLEELRIDLPSNIEVGVDILDDDFIVALVESCPGLRKLHIAGGRGAADGNIISKVTQRGLSALGSLSRLGQLVIRPLSAVTPGGLIGLLGLDQNQNQTQTPQQLDVKLLVPLSTKTDTFLSLIKEVHRAVAKSSSTRPFAVQIAVQEPPATPFLEDRKRKNASTFHDGNVLQQFISALKELQPVLADSRLRFQAVINNHARYVPQVTLFSTNWKAGNAITGLFLPREIGYDAQNDAAFEWIVL